MLEEIIKKKDNNSDFEEKQILMPFLFNVKHDF